MMSAGAPAPARSRSWEPVVRWALLLGTGAAYLWHVGSRGYGNAFYAAAVQAGTQSWKAFFFGSLDPANLITVDKPPASLWPMELSGRLVGFGTWSMMVPQVLMVVAAVAVLVATVRRVSGPVPGILAGALLALTPVVFAMFRFNDPDALLMLLLTVAAYTTVRAIQVASTRWLLLTGLAVGFAFLTKELQAFLAVPGFALAYAWAAPSSWGRRIVALLAAGAAMVAAAGWWVLAVALWPAADRPYLAGSTDNTELGRALGYNGLARILGRAARDVPQEGDRPGLTRLLHAPVSGYISWLLPAALVLLAAALWLTRRAPRGSVPRAALLLFGGWLVSGALVLSLMAGIFHEYYTLVLAPPIVGLVTVGGGVVWEQRRSLAARLVLAGVAAGTAVWSWALLVRYPGFPPRTASAVLALGLALAVVPLLAGGRRRGVSALAAAALVAAVAAPVGAATVALATRSVGVAAEAPTRTAAQGGLGLRGAGRGERLGRRAVVPVPAPGNLDALTALLSAARTRWSAATIGSSAAATLELASRTAVMAVGGYTGEDPVPTLARFQADVRAGEVHYFVAGGPIPGLGSAVTSILPWVRHHFARRTVDRWAVYDLLPRAATV